MQSNVIVNYSRQESSSSFKKNSEKKMVTNKQTDRERLNDQTSVKD
jgi:hypothetical protein